MKLTKKQIDDKAAELSKKLDCKVTPMVVNIEGGEQIVGYFQEPQYDTIMYFVDAYQNKELSKAGDYALADCIIKEESDERIYSTARKHSRIKASFAYACTKFLAPYTEEYKKLEEAAKKK